MIKDNLRRLRIEVGYSQAELAKVLEVHQQVISRWEKGERNPSPASLKKLSIALGCEIKEILEEKEMTRTIEQLEDQAKDITIAFYNDLEKEYGIEFTAEEVQKAIRSHQDTIDYEEEKDLKEDEFEETYRDWMEDSKDEIVDARIEKNIEESTARMEAYQREVGGGRLAFVEIDRSGDEFITEYPTIGDAVEAARSTWENVSYSEKKRKKREVRAAIILAGEGADFYEDEDGEIRSDYEPICSFGEYV